MKKIIWLLGATIPFLFSSCYVEPWETEYYSEYQPVLMTRTALATSIKWVEPKMLGTSGKIYIKGDLLFINEKFEGIHVYDNSDPSKPIAKGFITIPGNVDISIREDIFYADNARDLVTFRVVNGNSIEFLDRNENVFPELRPPDVLGIPSEYTEENRPENTVIVKWILK